MAELNFWWLMLLMFGLVMSLGWIGWRFFYGGAPATLAPMPRPAATPAPQPRLPRRPLWPELLAWRRRLNWHAIRWLLMAAAVVLLIILVTLQMAGYHVLRALSPQAYDRTQHIQLALKDEKLVPPPALPPSIFVSSERPSLAYADRDWSKLDPRFTQLVLTVIARMQERGYPIVLIEGYRSPERQDALADGDVHVTNARGGRSKHQYGLAADLAPMREGRIVLSERDPWAWEAYQALGEEAQAAGLVWGGGWSFKDYGHVEMKGPIAALTSGR
ncbi:M15 family metallopeptidase [Chitiniphilus purpureus]|uniref:M15 family metallopeptidase n=1 Tax=Chitiniphilus purpureus TaxID=2981137 RepID=A0ABY6DJN7_9NEIS|nr:M15 family metallopeptidase [Chitiniphilus sp. CD1]UXY14572.1 M15 family metallopeptidase [Chitiniphilus sp. CD1]